MAENSRDPIRTDDEALERDLNRHRGDEQRQARAEAIERLHGRGVTISSSAPGEAVVEVLEAVEAFERAVELRGGDLMVDTRPASEPDDPSFVLPKQRDGESLSDFARRIRNAAYRLVAERAD